MISRNGDGMKRTKNELAYAKINLFLDVVAKRDDGYHLIDGIMQNVTLSDRIGVTVEPSETVEVSLTSVGNSAMPTDATNLACRAAKLYLETVGRGGKVTIILEKKIPVASGLAGGSADAAAVLRALDSLSDAPLGIDALCRIGVKLGADVPFCVRGGAMRTQGIGDLLTPCAGLSDCFLVVACAGNGVSTPWAYGKLDLTYHSFSEPRNCDEKVEKLTHALQNRDFSTACATFENVFEEIVAKVNPSVGRIKTILTEAGAMKAMMSGSGPSVFGVFARESVAKNACERLAAAGFEGHFCLPVTEENLLR